MWTAEGTDTGHMCVARVLCVVRRARHHRAWLAWGSAISGAIAHLAPHQDAIVIVREGRGANMSRGVCRVCGAARVGWRGPAVPRRADPTRVAPRPLGGSLYPADDALQRPGRGCIGTRRGRRVLLVSAHTYIPQYTIHDDIFHGVRSCRRPVLARSSSAVARSRSSRSSPGTLARGGTYARS